MEAHQTVDLSDLIKNVAERNCDQVSKICYPLFKNTPVKYFDYGRYYDTGEMVICGTTSPDLVKMYYHDELCPSFEEFKLFTSFGLNVTYLSHIMPLPPGVCDVNPDRYNRNIESAACWKIFHRLYIVERYPGYFTAYGFGVIKETTSIFNFYLNAIPILRDFIKYYEYHASELIEYTKQNNRIIMPYYSEKKIRNCERFEEMLNISKLDFSIEAEKNISFDGKSMTSRELECLRLVSQGYTMKNIARKLEISHRTVEQHLRNIKDKLGLNTKNQLVEIWHEIIN